MTAHQANNSTGFSITRLKAPRNIAASLPSTTRWSAERVTFIRRLATMAPSTTAGTVLVPDTAKIAPSPGLIIAAKFSTSAIAPILEMVNVPPEYSLGASFPERAFSASCFTVREMFRTDSASAFLTTGTIKPSGKDTATPICADLEMMRWLLSNLLLTTGTSMRAQALALTIKSFTETLGIAPPAFLLSCSRTVSRAYIYTSTVT